VVFAADSHDELVGVLEMGGASTQIAFAPEGDILADKFPVLIGGRRYPLYVHSYLYYGQNEIDKRVRGVLLERSSSASSEPIVNPCMLPGNVAICRRRVIIVHELLNSLSCEALC